MRKARLSAKNTPLRSPQKWKTQSLFLQSTAAYDPRFGGTELQFPVLQYGACASNASAPITNHRPFVNLFMFPPSKVILIFSFRRRIKIVKKRSAQSYTELVVGKNFSVKCYCFCCGATETGVPL